MDTHERILLIGAHPDDYEIGLGMMITDMVEKGHQVFGVMASNGEKSSADKITSRRDEGEHAAKMMGLTDTYFLQHPDAGLPQHQLKIQEDLEKIIEEIKPNRVFVHSPDDRHTDHVAVRKATDTAARKVASVYGYLSPSILMSGLNAFPLYFQGNERLAAMKMTVIHDAYASQVAKDGIVSPENIMTEMRFFGKTVMPYANPTPLVEPLAPARSSFALGYASTIPARALEDARWKR